MSWVLYSVAHANTRIKSPDSEAWFKVLGFFNTKSAALDHAKNSNEEIRIAPANEFRILLKSTPDKDEEVRKHTSLLQLHSENRQNAFKETAKNASERKMGTIGYNVYDRQRYFQEEYGLKKDAYNILETTKSTEVRMQKFCALSIVPDYERIQESEMDLNAWKAKRLDWYAKERNKIFQSLIGDKKIQFDENVWDQLGVAEPDLIECTKTEFIQQNPIPCVMRQAEPAIKFIFAANTEDEIKNYIIKHSNAHKDFDVACVVMYEWIKASSFGEEKIARTFREPELAKLYKNKENNKFEAQGLVGKTKEIDIIA